MSKIDDYEYEGEKDENDLRHGKGKCTWNDGSEYDGQWHED